MKEGREDVGGAAWLGTDFGGGGGATRVLGGENRGVGAFRTIFSAGAGDASRVFGAGGGATRVLGGVNPGVGAFRMTFSAGPGDACRVFCGT
jgi:hypothetical protein